MREGEGGRVGVRVRDTVSGQGSSDWLGLGIIVVRIRSRSLCWWRRTHLRNGSGVRTHPETSLAARPLQTRQPNHPIRKKTIKD